ncbi:MAG: radical SAM protein [Candidatus Obscuribacterales bacterium]|nr:radical SAM protein [Candidatus Obscuribacterales bacterium]
MKRFHLITPVVGGLACGAKCPFCVAHMTPTNKVTMKAVDPDYAAFEEACTYAYDRGARCTLLTSKGEPTLWPDLVSGHLRVTSKFKFDRVELQTNGLNIADRKPVTDAHLKEWRELGLKLVAISNVHYDPAVNRGVYTPRRKEYIDLPKLIADLRGYGFKVRLATVLLRGYIDSLETLKKLMDFARENHVDELTVRPVNKPEDSQDDAVSKWIDENFLLPEKRDALQAYLDKAGKLVETFRWGARVYDVDGQNVCLTNCLTHDNPEVELGRQLIFFPEGKVADDWRHDALPLAEFDPTLVS